MNFILYKKDEPLVLIDLKVSPYSLIPQSYEIVRKDIVAKEFPLLLEDSGLEFLLLWLERRSILWEYSEGEELDSYIHSRLHTKAWQYGRMTMYQGLVSLLDHFVKEEDDYSLYSQKNEILWFGLIEPELFTCFHLKKKSGE